MEPIWQFWVDTGGTFTDVLAHDPQGQSYSLKVLSTGQLRAKLTAQVNNRTFRFSHNWPIQVDIFNGYRFHLLDRTLNAQIAGIDLERGELVLNQPLLEEINFPVAFEISAGEPAPVLAARLLTRTPLDGEWPSLQLQLGTTKGTNALLEQKGARVTLFITKGFKDLPYIGTQQRPDLFALNIPDPPLLYEQVIEVPERISADGTLRKALTDVTANRLIQCLVDHPPQAIAVALLHAYRNPVHEQRLTDRLHAAGYDYVSASHALSPVIKLYPRVQTALINAYLAPVIGDYLKGIRESLSTEKQPVKVRVLNSAGALMPAAHFTPKDSLLSGPAGGVVGAQTIGAKLGIDRLLTFDMGGTSTDASRVEKTPDMQFTTQIGPHRFFSPSIAIETVAAGGGSICTHRNGAFAVGPESAGADPGPACYGAGGPLTVTDVDFLLGKLDPARIGIPLDAQAAWRAAKALLEKAGGGDLETMLSGLERIADEKMAEAIRTISVARGFDPGDYILLAFGGAGGMHACRIAEILSTRQVILPKDAGILSAYGIQQARPERVITRQVLQTLADFEPHLTEAFKQMEQEAAAELYRENGTGIPFAPPRRLVFLRFLGQDHTLELTYQPDMELEVVFRVAYEQTFGHYPEDRTLEVESIRLILTLRKEHAERPSKLPGNYEPEPNRFWTKPFGEIRYPVFDWDTLSPGASFDGPAILVNGHATAFIPSNWRAAISWTGDALVKTVRSRRVAPRFTDERIATELFANRFTGIAQDMGAQLQRTAFSINIKERLDFSCAVLDPQGRLLVNAPHIPVHLGSLGVCARLILEEYPLEPGDVILTNHPAFGGSHLPDLTLLKGVFTSERHLIAYVINRAHHAELGGKLPGSMPPNARSLAEEGVVFLPTYLARAGKVDWGNIERRLREADYPSRSPGENLADLNAALAALQLGEKAIQQLVNQYGLQEVHHYMARLPDLASASLAAAVGDRLGQSYQATECLDDGHQLQVRIHFGAEKLCFDFSGTQGPHPGNLNANLAIVHSVVIYVLRLLCGSAIPLNEGLMERVELHLPPSLLCPDFPRDPRQCPAVVGGNTEVSQRLTDTLLKALELSACSQGTMNNVLFGNERFAYYETIGGGAGATAGFHGRSGVHQHMTNTSITDPEVLEVRFPVRIPVFGLRRGSGGAGQWPGGEGVIRHYTFLEKVEVTLLTQHRRERPYGMYGGGAGELGAQWIVKANGRRQPLGGIDSIQLEPGDSLIIHTPGGGGWGRN